MIQSSVSDFIGINTEFGSTSKEKGLQKTAQRLFHSRAQGGTLRMFFTKNGFFKSLGKHISNNVRDRSIHCIYECSDGICPRLVLPRDDTSYRNCKQVMKMDLFTDEI